MAQDYYETVAMRVNNISKEEAEQMYTSGMRRMKQIPQGSDIRTREEAMAFFKQSIGAHVLKEKYKLGNLPYYDIGKNGIYVMNHLDQYVHTAKQLTQAGRVPAPSTVIEHMNTQKLDRMASLNVLEESLQGTDEPTDEDTFD